MISTTKNSNKFQKTRLWKGKSVEDMVTLWPTTHVKPVYYNEEAVVFSKSKLCAFMVSLKQVCDPIWL
jgi:hypothetical protein